MHHFSIILSSSNNNENNGNNCHHIGVPISKWLRYSMQPNSDINHFYVYAFLGKCQLIQYLLSDSVVGILGIKENKIAQVLALMSKEIDRQSFRYKHALKTIKQLIYKQRNRQIFRQKHTLKTVKPGEVTERAWSGLKICVAWVLYQGKGTPPN